MANHKSLCFAPDFCTRKPPYFQSADFRVKIFEFLTEPTRGLNRDLACSILRFGVFIAWEATVSKIVSNLWYTEKAEEAAAFYASVLPNSKVDGVTALPADSPSGPAGSVKVVEFTLMGQPFMALSAPDQCDA
jgi:3-demethylubiquinone-9 3-methyltransferase